MRTGSARACVTIARAGSSQIRAMTVAMPSGVRGVLFDPPWRAPVAGYSFRQSRTNEPPMLVARRMSWVRLAEWVFCSSDLT